MYAGIKVYLLFLFITGKIASVIQFSFEYMYLPCASNANCHRRHIRQSILAALQIQQPFNAVLFIQHKIQYLQISLDNFEIRKTLKSANKRNNNKCDCHVVATTLCEHKTSTNSFKCMKKFAKKIQIEREHVVRWQSGCCADCACDGRQQAYRRENKENSFAPFVIFALASTCWLLLLLLLGAIHDFTFTQ